MLLIKYLQFEWRRAGNIISAFRGEGGLEGGREGLGEGAGREDGEGAKERVGDGREKGR